MVIFDFYSRKGRQGREGGLGMKRLRGMDVERGDLGEIVAT